DPGDVAQVGESPKPCLPVRDRLLVLLRREASADRGRRQVESRPVRQLDRLAERGARLRHRTLPERFELLVAETVEVLLRGELLVRGERQLDTDEAWVERSGRRARVDVDHRCDPVGYAVTRIVPGRARA